MSEINKKNQKPAELSDKEMDQVTGGNDTESVDNKTKCPICGGNHVGPCIVPELPEQDGFGPGISTQF